MTGAKTGFFSRANLAHARNKAIEHRRILKIYFSDILFAKKTFHEIKTVFYLRQFLLRFYLPQ